MTASSGFIPPGKKISSYRPTHSKGKAKSTPSKKLEPWIRCESEEEEEDEDVIYELWAANWKTPGFREYHRRMQVFVLFYIEGGSYIEEDDHRWEFVILWVLSGRLNDHTSYRILAKCSSTDTSVGSGRWLDLTHRWSTLIIFADMFRSIPSITIHPRFDYACHNSSSYHPINLVDMHVSRLCSDLNPIPLLLARPDS